MSDWDKPLVIISLNDNPLYAGFFPMVKHAWERIGFEVELIDVGGSSHPGIPYENWSQVSRILRYGDYGDRPVMVADVDSLPLKSDPYYILWSSVVFGERLAIYGWDAYEDDEYDCLRKFPGGNMTATSDTWKQIINPDGLNDADLLQSWSEIESLDGRADPFMSNFCEESLIRELAIYWHDNGGLVLPFARGWHRTASGLRAYRRIDRADWHIDEPLLHAGGYYIDAHLPRPLCDHLDAVRPLAEYLGVEL